MYIKPWLSLASDAPKKLLNGNQCYICMLDYGIQDAKNIIDMIYRIMAPE